MTHLYIAKQDAIVDEFDGKTVLYPALYELVEIYDNGEPPFTLAWYDTWEEARAAQIAYAFDEA